MSHDVNGEVLDTTTTSLEILEALQEMNGPTSTELAEQFDIPTSTLHVHLNTLRKKSYVTREGNRYYPGLKLLKLGEHAKHRGDLYEIATENVHWMAQETKFEADFLLCQNGKMFLLYGEIGAATDPNFQIGREFYMHSTGTGKAILAEWSRDRVDTIIDRWGLPERTENTITTKEQLYEELKQTDTRGFGVNDEECLNGYRTIGTVIHGPLGNAIGGLGIGGPTYRIDDDTLYQQLPSILSDASEKFETEIRNSVRAQE